MCMSYLEYPVSRPLTRKLSALRARIRQRVPGSSRKSGDRPIRRFSASVSHPRSHFTSDARLKPYVLARAMSTLYCFPLPTYPRSRLASPLADPPQLSDDSKGIHCDS